MKIVYAPRELDIVIRKLRSQHPIFFCGALRVGLCLN